MKKKSTSLVLSILLGELGIDRMYLGYDGLAILKFLTLGGFGIWWIIDIILILSNSLKPSDGSEFFEIEQREKSWRRIMNTSAYSSQTAPQNVSAALKELYALYEMGAITREEYREKKAILLEQISMSQYRDYVD